MIRIGICDDVAEQLIMQRKMVENIMTGLCINAEVNCFRSGEDLLCEIEQKGSLDIILLDIEMEGINGVETARIIREKDFRVMLLFVSFHDQYCKKIISVQPFAFIDKPVSEKQMESVLRHALEILEELEEIFEYTYKKVSYRIPVKKIRYFESEKRKVHIYTTDEVCSFYRKLDEVEQEMDKTDTKFLRISKSYLVNTNYIKEQRFGKVVMNDGTEIKIGPSYKERARKDYIEMMGKI